MVGCEGYGSLQECLGNTSDSSNKKINNHSRTKDEHEFISYPRFLSSKKNAIIKAGMAITVFDVFRVCVCV